MMNRRSFLKLTAVIAAGQALQAAPTFAEQAWASPTAPPSSGPAAPSVGRLLVIDQPGTYLIVGQVRLQEPVVEISGIANRQQISWSDANVSTAPAASFVSYEHFAIAGSRTEILVRGGELELLSVVPVDLGD